MDSFVIRQLSQIGVEGWPAVRRKARRLLFLTAKFLLVITAVSLVLMIRIIRPLVWIRFGYFLPRRIGHFAEIQAMALALNKQGILIGLCSKNNPRDADEEIIDLLNYSLIVATLEEKIYI